MVFANDNGGTAKTNVEGTYEQSGGSKDAVVVTHTHTGSTSTHNGHQHSMNFHTTSKSGNATPHMLSSPINGENLNGDDNLNTNTGGAHSHSLNINAPSGSSDGVNKNLPPYFALAFIMKT